MMKRLIFTLFLIALFYTGNAQQSHELPHPEGVLYYELYGVGSDTLLLINGGPGMNSRGFQGLAQLLSKGRVVVLYDQRGTGRSTLNEVSEETVTLEKMAADLELLRSHLGIRRWKVMGHSFGGMLGAYYTSRYPESVCSMVQSSSGGLDMGLFDGLSIRSRLTQLQRDSLAYWEGKMANGDTSYQVRYERGKHLAPAYLSDDKYIPQVAHRLTQANYTVNRLVYADMRKIGFDCKEELATYQGPVLVIQGADDVVPVAISKKGHSVFPNSELIILEDCNHYGWLEQPEAYFGAIFSFLDHCDCDTRLPCEVAVSGGK